MKVVALLTISIWLLVSNGTELGLFAGVIVEACVVTVVLLVEAYVVLAAVLVVFKVVVVVKFTGFVWASSSQLAQSKLLVDVLGFAQFLLNFPDHQL